MIEKRGLSDQVYAALKQQILDQQLPPGARLNIDSQARALGVSSTPVREALNRLTSERLVVSEHYSGYRVAPPISMEFHAGLLDYRMVIEGHCAEIGAAKKDKAIIAGLTAAQKKMAKFERIGTRYDEYRQFVNADAAFHDLIVASGGNPVMIEQYRSLNAIYLQSRLYLYRSGGVRSDEVIAEHQKILDAYVAGDGYAARKAIEEHLNGGRRRLLHLPH